MGVNEVKEKLAKMGITEVNDDIIEELLSSGLDDDTVVELLKESSQGSQETNTVKEQPQSPVEPEQNTTVSVPVDSSVKKVIQKETAKATKDVLQRFLEQVPPKGYIKIFLWDEDSMDWAFVAKVSADILKSVDIHAFLKKKYAKYDGINKFKLEFYDSMNNKLTESEISVLNEKKDVLAGVVSEEGGDEMEIIHTVKEIFEKMEKEKEKVYQQMLQLQQQLAQKEVEQAQRTMEFLQQQLQFLEETYKKKLEEIRRISETEGSEAQQLVAELSYRFESQLSELKNLVMNVINQVSSTLRQKGDDNNTILQVVLPIIQTALSNLNKKDDSIEKIMQLINFIEKIKGKEQKIDPIQQLKVMTEVIKNIQGERKEVDPTQQFQTLFSLVKELMPKQTSITEELQKFTAIADILGLKKDEKEKLIYELIKEMKESQKEMIESLSKIVATNNKDEISSVINILVQQQQQQMQQMQMQMQMMMEQFRSAIESLAKRTEPPAPQQSSDPLDQIVESMAKIEKLKQVLGTGSSSSGSFWSKLLEGIGNVLPALIQQGIFQQQQPSAGFYGVEPPVQRVVVPTRARKKIVRVRRKPVQKAVKQVAPPQAPQAPQAPNTQPKQLGDLEMLKNSINVFDKSTVPKDILEKFTNMKSELADRMATTIKGVEGYKDKRGEEIFDEVVKIAKEHNIDESALVSPYVLAFDSKEDMVNEISNRLPEVDKQKIVEFVDKLIDLAKTIIIQQMER